MKLHVDDPGFNTAGVFFVVQGPTINSCWYVNVNASAFFEQTILIRSSPVARALVLSCVPCLVDS